MSKETPFDVEVVVEGDMPNIYISNNSDNKLYAKIWIYPDGRIEVRRFLKDKQIAYFIDENGKIKPIT